MWVCLFMGWPEPYMYTVRDHMCSHFPANDTVYYTPYIRIHYLCMVLTNPNDKVQAASVLLGNVVTETRTQSCQFSWKKLLYRYMFLKGEILQLCLLFSQ